MKSRALSGAVSQRSAVIEYTNELSLYAGEYVYYDLITEVLPFQKDRSGCADYGRPGSSLRFNIHVNRADLSS